MNVLTNLSGKFNTAFAIFAGKNLTDMKPVTKERWYGPTLDEQGNLVKERESTLDYPKRYTFYKVDGRWLIQKLPHPIATSTNNCRTRFRSAPGRQT